MTYIAVRVGQLVLKLRMSGELAPLACRQRGVSEVDSIMSAPNPPNQLQEAGSVISFLPCACFALWFI
jgi:hypothetical protein